MWIKLVCDRRMADKLIQVAVRERRSVQLQAEVLVRRALGMPDWDPEEPGDALCEAGQPRPGEAADAR